MKLQLFLAAIALSTGIWAQDGPKFDAASIKPNRSGDGRGGFALEPGGRVVATNISLKVLITMAYQLKGTQLSGLPGWAESERFDITAKPESGANVKEENIRAMLRSMLAERFQLAMHKETKELPVYALVVAKNGPRLKPSTGNADFFEGRGAADAAGHGRGAGIRRQRGEASGANVTMEMIADQLSQIVGRNVIDKTGLSGNYNFTLKYTPELMQAPPPGASSEAAPPTDAPPSIFVALQEQLGLKLEPQKGPVDVYVIDHVERPSEN